MIGCLMIHGYTGSPYEVGPLADYLREHTDWFVDVPTLPGHGSELHLENVSHKSWLTAAENSLKELKEKTDKIYLIGFSMGGMIAAYLASKHNIDKLVLLAPSGKYLSFRQIARDFKGVIADGFKGKLKENNLYLHYKQKWGTVPFKANIEFLKLVRFTRRYLNKVKSPVMIAHGQQDMVVPYKTGYYLDKEMTSEQKEVVFFERSGHLICLGDDNVTLNRLIYEFLTEEKEGNAVT
ncbi:carboxylesterase [Lentibacillus sp. CBA3610]|uniref:alpha/beta hydrolase n=1 Tax=Lentibacillus sp. CBA3610 TaxID=2518176 RepID=UPI001595F2B4|nr:alpha/beta fold hydrolase [Lentibacillus sp. CBA3610]QKY71199.1 alpha/beta fold hydrolase [Lentibacillus sp. CBA3610]